MALPVVPGLLSALLSALAFGLVADAAGTPADKPAQRAVAERKVVPASAPEPVRQARSACRLIVGWPGCAPKPKPKPPPVQPPPQPVQPVQPAEPACDRECIVLRRANTPAQRPESTPDMPPFPDDDPIDLGTLPPPSPGRVVD